MKVKFAQQINVSNCDCCGAVHVELRRDGKIFAVAIPASVEEAADFARELQEAIVTARQFGSTPHVH